MPSVYGTLYNWARKTSTSFGELRFLASQRDDMENLGDELIYKLKYWPELSSHDRTADVFRTLSVMSTRPINRKWILTHSKLRARQVDQLLQRLVEEGAVEVIDRSKFAIRVTPVKAACRAR
jgi:hypothetical protein